jgi:hypothetical protein
VKIFVLFLSNHKVKEAKIMRKKLAKNFSAVLILIIVVGCHTNRTTKVFTADMVQKINNRNIEGKIFIKGNEYRMDINEKGEDISIIVNRESGKQKIVIHSGRTAQEVLNNSSRSISNNPFESFYYALEENSSREKGTEVINGHECKKIEVYSEDKILITAWVSDSLNLPIKIKTERVPIKEVELSNIKEETIEGDLFRVPEGYRFSRFRKPKKSKTKPKKETVNIKEIRQTALKKIEESGIELENENGKIKLRRIIISSLARYFPGWYFFRVNREKIVQNEILLSEIPLEKAAIYKDEKTVYLIKSPKTDTSLDEVLKTLLDKDVKLDSEEDLKDFGKALFILYFREGTVQDVEILGENEWAIYEGTDSGYLKGFTVKLDNNGKILKLNYKLKIKEQ